MTWAPLSQNTIVYSTSLTICHRTVPKSRHYENDKKINHKQLPVFIIELALQKQITPFQRWGFDITRMRLTHMPRDHAQPAKQKKIE